MSKSRKTIKQEARKRQRKLERKLTKRDDKIEKLKAKVSRLRARLESESDKAAKILTHRAPAKLVPLPAHSELEKGAYDFWQQRLREGRPTNEEADWYRSEAEAWKRIALSAHEVDSDRESA